MRRFLVTTLTALLPACACSTAPWGAGGRSPNGRAAAGAAQVD